MQTIFDAIIIGSGIAGLSTAWELSKSGLRVCIIDQADTPAYYASRLNAAMWLPIETNTNYQHLAKRTFKLLSDCSDTQGWLEILPTLLPSRDALKTKQHADALSAYNHDAHYVDTSSSSLCYNASLFKLPLDAKAIYIKDSGVIQTKRLINALVNACKRAGCIFKMNTSAKRINHTPTDVQGVLTSKHDNYVAKHVICTTGAFGASYIAESLRPTVHNYQRHLSVWSLPSQEQLTHMVWTLDSKDACYLRPYTPYSHNHTSLIPSKANYILVCHGDHTPLAPQDEVYAERQTRESYMSEVKERIGQWSSLLEDADMHTYWSCVRSYHDTHSDMPFIATNHGLRGLSFCVGLGGQGMTLGVGAGEALGKALLS